VVCHGRVLSFGLDPTVTYIFYNQNIAFCSTITMVLDLLGLDHCMDEDKTKSTQTCVILVSFGESMPGNWLYLQATSLTQKMPSLVILNTQLDLMQCQPCGITNCLALCHTPWLFISLNSFQMWHTTWHIVWDLHCCMHHQTLWVQACAAQKASSKWFHLLAPALGCMYRRQILASNQLQQMLVWFANHLPPGHGFWLPSSRTCVSKLMSKLVGCICSFPSQLSTGCNCIIIATCFLNVVGTGL